MKREDLVLDLLKLFIALVGGVSVWIMTGETSITVLTVFIILIGALGLDHYKELNKSIKEEQG